MTPKKTSRKFLGQPVYSFEMLGAKYLRGIAGPFQATVEPTMGGFEGRLQVSIPGQGGVPVPFVTQNMSNPRDCLRKMEEKARELSKAIQKALRGVK